MPGGKAGYSLVELLVVISVIAILFFAYPSIVWMIGSAQDSTVRWQEKSLNQTYRQYLAAGGQAAQTKEQALAILSSHPMFQIHPQETLSASSGRVHLEFDDEKQVFAYSGGGEKVAQPQTGLSAVATATPVDLRELVGVVSLTLDVRASGGTATYGGQDLGVGPMPSFMLSGSGGTFTLHNSGGYDNLPTWFSLDEFVSDLESSEDRFNPTQTKVLPLEKDGKRYDLEFLRWDNGQRLRLRSAALYE